MGEDGGAAAEALPDPEALAAVLRVFGNPRRLELLPFLSRPRTVEDMAARLGIARQNAQEHLQQLLAVGVARRLEERGPGGSSRFVLDPARLFGVQEEFARLGALRAEEAGDARAPTHPLGSAWPAGERDLPRLVVARGLRPGGAMVLAGPGPWLLGRDPGAALSLDYDPWASVRHAEVRRAPAGGFEVADLYSRNGTWVDGERLPRGGAARLESGALLGVGRSVVVFRRPA